MRLNKCLYISDLLIYKGNNNPWCYLLYNAFAQHSKSQPQPSRTPSITPIAINPTTTSPPAQLFLFSPHNHFFLLHIAHSWPLPELLEILAVPVSGFPHGITPIQHPRSLEHTAALQQLLTVHFPLKFFVDVSLLHIAGSWLLDRREVQYELPEHPRLQTLLGSAGKAGYFLSYRKSGEVSRKDFCWLFSWTCLWVLMICMTFVARRSFLARRSFFSKF